MKSIEKLYLLLTVAFLPLIGLGFFLLYKQLNSNSYQTILKYIPYNEQNNFFQLFYLKIDKKYNNLLNILKEKNIYNKNLLKNYNIFTKNVDEIAVYKDSNNELIIIKIKKNGNFDEFKKSILLTKNINFKKFNEYIYYYNSNNSTLQKTSKNSIYNLKYIKEAIPQYNTLFISKIDQNLLKNYIKNLKINPEFLLIKGNIAPNTNIKIQTIFNKDKNIENIYTKYTFSPVMSKFFDKNDILYFELGPILNIFGKEYQKLLALGMYQTWQNSNIEGLKDLYTLQDFENLTNIFSNNIGLKVWNSNTNGILPNANLIFSGDYVYNFVAKFRPIVLTTIKSFKNGDIQIIGNKNNFGFKFKTFLGEKTLSSKLTISKLNGLSIISLGDLPQQNQNNIKKFFNNKTILHGYINGKKLIQTLDNIFTVIPVIKTYQENLISMSDIFFNIYFEKNKLNIDININIK